MDAAKGPYLFGFTACPGGGEGIVRSGAQAFLRQATSLALSRC
ncbi:hypothetical protein FHY33_000376 [Xanthomonas arboricola]|nr:hypothetical protein [Xanthomonas campestris]